MNLNNNQLPSDSELQHAYNRLGDAIAECVDERNSLQKQIARLESNITSMQSSISSLHTTYEKTKIQLEAERSKRLAVEKQLDKEQSQNVRLRKEVEELQSMKVFISHSSRDKKYIDSMSQYLTDIHFFDYYKELGHHDDKAIKTILDMLDKMDKLKLTRENEQMRTQQQSWRESEEYKAEIAKYEKASKQTISVDQVKEGLKKILQRFTSVSELSNFIYRLNEVLRKTAWDTVSPDIIDDMTTLFNKSQQKQPTTINYNAPVTNNGTMNGDVNNNTSKS